MKNDVNSDAKGKWLNEEAFDEIFEGGNQHIFCAETNHKQAEKLVYLIMQILWCGLNKWPQEIDPMKWLWL